ncbi:NUDIX domain-containing protein [Streptomyces sp. NPDC002248]
MKIREGYVRAVWPMAVSALIRDEDGRVLLVNPTYHPDRWLMAGGGMNRDGRPPHEALCRELREELGMRWPVGRMLAVDWVPQQGKFFEEMLYVFDGGVMGADDIASIRAPEDELSGFAFMSLDAAVSRLAGLDAARLRAAHRAQESGSVLYLNASQPVS